jgi:tetratricopeptide (TPR) repeat protein
MNDLKQATEAYKKLTELDPHSALSHFSYGRALYLKEDYAAALTAFAQALRLDPDYLLGYLFKGQCLEKQGDRTQAKAVYLQGQTRAKKLTLENFEQQFAALLITLG